MFNLALVKWNPVFMIAKSLIINRIEAGNIQFDFCNFVYHRSKILLMH